MFVPFSKSDGILDREPFINDEVCANPIHRIADEPDSKLLVDDTGNIICAYSPKLPAWIWVSPEITGYELRKKLAFLAQVLYEAGVRKTLSNPDIAAEFALFYSLKTELKYKTTMMLYANSCKELKKPNIPEGKVINATFAYTEKVAEFCTDFWKETIHGPVGLDATTRSAESMIDRGDLYLWSVNGEIVSMANIIYRSPRHGRINSIYTAPQYREKGYGAALVYSLCKRLVGEGLIPILFTDRNNKNMNTITKELGFTIDGSVDEVTYFKA